VCIVLGVSAAAVSARHADSTEDSLLSHVGNRLEEEGGLLEEMERTVEVDREGGPCIMTGGQLLGGVQVPLVVADRVIGGTRGWMRHFWGIATGLEGF
jgi:hypothetical protein